MKIARFVSAVLATAALACIAVAFGFAYQAGCAGDLKTGSGDPLRALSLENYSAAWMGVGIFGGCIAILASAHDSWLVKVLAALAGLLLGAPLFWLAAVIVEHNAIRNCL